MILLLLLLLYTTTIYYYYILLLYTTTTTTTTILAYLVLVENIDIKQFTKITIILYDKFGLFVIQRFISDWQHWSLTGDGK